MDAKPLESEMPWLNPDNLMDFLDELREAGFAVVVPDYVKVHELVILLLANGVELKQPAQLGRYLGPLLCSSEIEQLEFQPRFANWIGRLNAAAKATTQDQDQLVLQEELELYLLDKSGKNSTSYQNLLRRYLGLVPKGRRTVPIRIILVVLSLISAVLIFFINPNMTDVLKDYIPQLPSEAALPDNSQQPSEPALPDNSQQPSEPASPDSRDVDFPLGRIMSLIGVLASVVSLVIFWRIFVHWLARQYLERHSTKEKPLLDTISIAHDMEALFPPIAFFRLAERMRRRIRVASQELDINATLQHMLSQGGWFIPVLGTRLQVPEYLILIDRTTFRDHQTQLIEEMVAQLTEHEVFASIFFFDREPRICYPADGKTRGVRLQALAKRHADNRLLLFTDAEHLFHPLRNDLTVWSDFFLEWSERVLLTTKSREHWGYYETQLQSVMTVLPATADSLTNFVMGDLLERRQQNTEQMRPPLPSLLTERPYRWLNRDQPDEALIVQVLLGLRVYLDRAGFFWLCACAIFPKLQWDITLYLGKQLKTDEGITLLSYDRLVALARLPWFRHGYMPDWFRLYLISTLTHAQEGDVRQTLQALLLNTVNGTLGTYPFEIARPLDFRSQSILRLLARNASENSPFQDYIFRTYIANNERLSVRIPVQLRDKLLSGDRRSLDRAIWRQWMMTHALGGTLIWLMGFFLWSFLINKYSPSGFSLLLLLLVTSFVVFSFASLQVWGGRRRIEPNWNAFRSSLGGMAFTHISILLLLLLFWPVLWWFDEWPFWAIVGAVIGLSDSLGRYLFSNKHDENGLAHLKPYASVVGFAVGFVLFNWWIKTSIPPEILWLAVPFVIWTCYGIVTGAALVWGYPKAIPITHIWDRIRLRYVGQPYGIFNARYVLYFEKNLHVSQAWRFLVFWIINFVYIILILFSINSSITFKSMINFIFYITIFELSFINTTKGLIYFIGNVSRGYDFKEQLKFDLLFLLLSFFVKNIVFIFYNLENSQKYLFFIIYIINSIYLLFSYISNNSLYYKHGSFLNYLIINIYFFNLYTFNYYRLNTGFVIISINALWLIALFVTIPEEWFDPNQGD